MITISDIALIVTVNRLIAKYKRTLSLEFSRTASCGGILVDQHIQERKERDRQTDRERNREREREERQSACVSERERERVSERRGGICEMLYKAKEKEKKSFKPPSQQKKRRKKSSKRSKPTARTERRDDRTYWALRSEYLIDLKDNQPSQRKH